MTEAQAQVWQGIVVRCARMVQCTVGSAPRRDAVMAVDAELRRLQARVDELEGWSDDHDARPAGAAAGAV